jgi:hypothetical protein
MTICLTTAIRRRQVCLNPAAQPAQGMALGLEELHGQAWRPRTLGVRVAAAAALGLVQVSHAPVDADHPGQATQPLRQRRLYLRL